MKTLLMTFLAFILVTSCADKNANKSGSGSAPTNNSFSSTPGQASLVDGYILPNSGQIEAGGTMFYVSDQQSASIIQNALNQARQQNIQPLSINGVYKFRARVTGFQVGPGSLSVSSVQIY